MKTKVLILGAGGREFHNFNTVFRDDERYEVVAFTAAQIPNIEGRLYPPLLAGKLYPKGIPVFPEKDLESLIEKHHIDQVIFSYSDVAHEEVMHRASRTLAVGAGFRLLGFDETALEARRPVISVCAVRTGCGKSPATRWIAARLRERGLRVAVVRHPMPYGDLEKQVTQRFASFDDLQEEQCTIEEMEEYEPHIRQGAVVYAGVDYEKILRRAEAEADVILWDGGNNDLPFFRSNLEIVLVDPHRAGHERRYFPGEVNLLRADVLLLAKVSTAKPEDLATVRENARRWNPRARVIESTMPVSLEDSVSLRGQRVLVVEDGPTLTHGEMRYGAGVLAAKENGAKELVDPRPYAVGSIAKLYESYPHVECLLPAMGYGEEQIRELEQTIAAVDCDVVAIATPMDLRRLLRIPHPTCRVSYRFEPNDVPALEREIDRAVGRVAS